MVWFLHRTLLFFSVPLFLHHRPILVLVSPESQKPRPYYVICIVTIYCIPHSVLDKIKRTFPSLALTLLAARVLCNYVYLLFLVLFLFSFQFDFGTLFFPSLSLTHSSCFLCGCWFALLLFFFTCICWSVCKFDGLTMVNAVATGAA